MQAALLWEHLHGPRLQAAAGLMSERVLADLCWGHLPTAQQPGSEAAGLSLCQGAAPKLRLWRGLKQRQHGVRGWGDPQPQQLVVQREQQTLQGRGVAEGVGSCWGTLQLGCLTAACA